MTYTEWVLAQRRQQATGGVTEAEAKAEADRLTVLHNRAMSGSR